MKKQIVFPLIILVVLIGGLWLGQSRRSSNDDSLRSAQNSPTPKNNNHDNSDSSDSDSGSSAPLPATFALKVPFTPQAPTANWDELHNEACEEASALMAYYYFNQPAIASGLISADQAEREIAKLTEWEKRELGYNLSITTKETQRMIEEVYGLHTEIIEDFTETDLKKELAQGRLIVFPANGQMLDNPNFKSPGPIYHMLVIKGYDRQGFVTNDPGTRKGFNYPYTFDTLYDANGDYSHETKAVDLSKKMAIVVWK